MAGGIEYHWVLCFTSPLSCGHGMTFTMRTGTDTLDVETRSEAFELLVRRVADEEGRGVDDFAVTFFTLEPNRLPAHAEPPTVRLDVPHIKDEMSPRRIAQDLADALGRRSTRRTGMDFGGALKALKDGMKATREGWDVPGRYVFVQDTHFTGSKHTPYDPDGTVFHPFLMVHHPNGSYEAWSPSGVDLLADDWLVASPDGDIRWPDGTVG